MRLTSEVRVLDDGAEDPGVGDHHDEEWDEVDGGEEEEGEGGHGPGVGPERHALLHARALGRGTSVPHEHLEPMQRKRMIERESATRLDFQTCNKKA